jgi:histidine phosphotransfer protein HptB
VPLDVAYGTTGVTDTPTVLPLRSVTMWAATPRSESAMLSSPEPSNTLPAAGWPAPGVLDADALMQLATLDPGGTSGLLARVLNTYRVSLARLLDQLQIARTGSDLQTQRHVVHTLKSSSASVGALALSSLCAEAERRLREGAADNLDGLLDALACEGRRLTLALGAP